MAFEPINRSQVIAALRELGPMTRHELAEHLGWPVPKVGTTIGSTRWLLPEQVFRVVGYVAITGMRGRDVAVYAAEAGPDIARRAPDMARRRKVTQARYREKNRATINARHRIARAEKAGMPVASNPWIGLAPPDMRATMTRAHRQASA